jgi:hypothetical protein
MSCNAVEQQVEFVCGHCGTVIGYEPWPHPFDEGLLCTECLGTLFKENEEADLDG